MNEKNRKTMAIITLHDRARLYDITKLEYYIRHRAAAVFKCVDHSKIKKKILVPFGNIIQQYCVISSRRRRIVTVLYIVMC